MPDAAAARAVLADARATGRNALTEAEAKRVLAAFGVAVPRGRRFDATPQGPLGAGLTPPFALKIISRDILHKTEFGGVRIALADEAALAAARSEMAARIAQGGWRIEGWLVEEMAPRGVEVVVGALHDARFGPVVMCGLGGVLVELLQDIAFALCPLDAVDCEEMLGTLRGRALLQGWRGAPAAAMPELHQVLLRIGGVGGLLETLGEDIAELDINPLIVSPTGAVAADARIMLRDRP